MTHSALKYFDILQARQAYAEGRNITELLRQQKQVASNTPDIIETAYDLQAGTYIAHVEQHPQQAHAYTAELADILGQHLHAGDSLLDIGTGELTTLSLLGQKLPVKPHSLYAFDISWSRLHKGLDFAHRNMGAELFERLVPFAADIGEIPLRDKSVSITTSSHALEPNGPQLSQLMAELFRVTADKLVLFEPCYELNSDEGRARMDRLGYIKDMEGVVHRLGGRVIDKIRIQHTSNPLNPTVCFVITPPAATDKRSPASRPSKDAVFSVPGTDHALSRLDEGFYFSRETGLAFPVLKQIPVLKSRSAILASALAG